MTYFFKNCDQEWSILISLVLKIDTLCLDKILKVSLRCFKDPVSKIQEDEKGEEEEMN